MRQGLFNKHICVSGFGERGQTPTHAWACEASKENAPRPTLRSRHILVIASSAGQCGSKGAHAEARKNEQVPASMILVTILARCLSARYTPSKNVPNQNAIKNNEKWIANLQKLGGKAIMRMSLKMKVHYRMQAAKKAGLNAIHNDACKQTSAFPTCEPSRLK